MKPTLAQRLLLIMEEQQISQVELAAVAGCTRGRINQMVRDARKCKHCGCALIPQ
jgi:predicted XRE-type DNA-binding protein